jgi:hypothetical protein
MLNIGLKMETVFKIIKRNQYIVFVGLLILIHLLLNNYPDYKITGFNILTYKYLFVSLFSISIFIGLFYIVKTYYKKLDKIFYYTFFVYFIVLFIYSLLFYPAGSSPDTIVMIHSIEKLVIANAYPNTYLLYGSLLWLTSTLYVVTFVQIILISFMFAYFMSFCSNFISLKFLFFINLFFLLNPLFWQYGVYLHNNVVTNYSILFLGIFLFKALIENTLIKKQSISIVCALSFLIGLARGEAIVIPFISLFIYIFYVYKNSFSIGYKLKTLSFLLLTIFITFLFKINYDRYKDYHYNAFLYENIITSIMSNSKFNTHNKKLDSKIISYYGTLDYPYKQKEDKNKQVWAYRQYISSYDISTIKKQKELAVALLLDYPFIYLKNQLIIFDKANQQKFFLGNYFDNTPSFSSRYWSKKQHAPKRPDINNLTYTEKYNIGFIYKNMLYVGFIILLTSILFYRYNPYTALISTLFLSSKLLVFVSAWDFYFMQQLLLYYAIPIIPLMAWIEMKKRKKLDINV